MNKKKAWRLIIIITPLSLIIFFETKAYFERKTFFKNPLNTTINKIENNSSGGRSYDYITKNNIVITLLELAGKSLDLNIGDSVVKAVNSWQFDIYRKDENNLNYFFYKRFDLEKINQ